MPILTKDQQAKSAIIDHMDSLAGWLRNCAQKANAIAATALSLDDDALASFLNAPGFNFPADAQRHFDLGSGINAAINAVNETLAENGLPEIRESVDVRPFADKLSDQGRTVSYADGVFSVSQIPQPEPETEQPETEPQP